MQDALQQQALVLSQLHHNRSLVLRCVRVRVKVVFREARTRKNPKFALAIVETKWTLP